MLEDIKFYRASFRSALKSREEKENYHRNKNMLDNLKGKRYTEFWREVEKLKSQNKLCSQKIDYPVGLFSNIYRKILANQEIGSAFKYSRINILIKHKVHISLRFSIHDIRKAIDSLNTGIGFDSIHLISRYFSFHFSF